MKYMVISDIHGNPRAIETVVDTFSYHQELELHRVECNTKKRRASIVDAGLPKVLGDAYLYGR